MPHRIAGVEFARLTSLYRYGVLDTAADPAIDLVLARLAERLDAPAAQLVFADAQQLVATSSIGSIETCALRKQGPFETLLNGGPDFMTLSADVAALPRSAEPLRSLAALRIAGSDEEVLGVLLVADTRDRVFATEARDSLAAAGAEIQILLESARRGREDPATGALRRDAFLEQAQRLIAVSCTGRQWVSLVTLDLAAFRAALHAKAPGLGSLATRLIADLGRSQVRGRDSFGMMGEDTFVILLTDTGESGAQVLAKRLAQHLERGWTDAGIALDGIALNIASIKPLAGDDALKTLFDRVAIGSPPFAPPIARVA